MQFSESFTPTSALFKPTQSFHVSTILFQSLYSIKAREALKNISRRLKKSNLLAPYWGINRYLCCHSRSGSKPYHPSPGRKPVTWRSKEFRSSTATPPPVPDRPQDEYTLYSSKMDARAFSEDPCFNNGSLI